MSEARRRQAEEVKRMASYADPVSPHCKVLGCPNKARSATTDGLSNKYCRSHYDHLQTHGSPFKSSYRAKELNPYRQAALVWLTDNEDILWTKDAIGKVQSLYRSAGPHIEAFRLRGMKPKDRAKAHWARLRKHEIDPRLPVAAWIAIEMLLKDDPQPDWRPEYKRVQAAKVVHRMASGSHKRWDSGPVKQELHVYPRPRGRVLRHIGMDLERACELLVDHHLTDLQQIKADRDQTGASYTSSPYPNGWSGRSRS